MMADKKKKPTQYVIAVTQRGRELAEKVMEQGRHGTLSNTVLVALETHLRFLHGDLTENSQKQPAASAA